MINIILKCNLCTWKYLKECQGNIEQILKFSCLLLKSQIQRMIFLLSILKIVLYSPLWRRQWQPTPILLPGKSHGQRSLVGCGPWGR